MDGPKHERKGLTRAAWVVSRFAYRRVFTAFPHYSPAAPVADPGTAQVDGRDAWERGATDRGAVAVVVVLYNPSEAILEGTRGYTRLADRVYVVDNSDASAADPRACLSEDAFTHVDLGGNRGIARGLNVGVQHALADGYALALLMDQDSDCPAVDTAERLASEASAWPTRVGIVTALAVDPIAASTRPRSAPTEAVLTTITTGSLLNLTAYRAVGTFRDDLFIDQVDSEYCLRLHEGGWEVLETSLATISHSIGSVTKHVFLGVELTTTNHTPLRKYYSARNRILVWRAYRSSYPDYRTFERGQLIVEAAKILLFEDRKLAKLKMIWRGISDGMAGVTGKYRRVRD